MENLEFVYDQSSYLTPEQIEEARELFSSIDSEEKIFICYDKIAGFVKDNGKEDDEFKRLFNAISSLKELLLHKEDYAEATLAPISIALGMVSFSFLVSLGIFREGELSPDHLAGRGFGSNEA